MFSKPKKTGKHDPLRMQVMILREMREDEDREHEDDEDEDKPKKRRKARRDKLQQKESY